MTSSESAFSAVRAVKEANKSGAPFPKARKVTPDEMLRNTEYIKTMIATSITRIYCRLRKIALAMARSIPFLNSVQSLMVKFIYFNGARSGNTSLV